MAFESLTSCDRAPAHEDENKSQSNLNSSSEKPKLQAEISRHPCLRIHLVKCGQATPLPNSNVPVTGLTSPGCGTKYIQAPTAKIKASETGALGQYSTAELAASSAVGREPAEFASQDAENAYTTSVPDQRKPSNSGEPGTLRWED